MNRRNFLGMLAASLSLDPERLLWVPGAKLISIPKAANVEQAVAEELSLRYTTDFFVSTMADKYGPTMWPPPISDAEARAAAKADGQDFPGYGFGSRFFAANIG